MHIGIDARLPFYQMGGISQYVLYLIQALAEIDSDNHYTVFQSRKDHRVYAPKVSHFDTGRLWTPCHHRWERWALAAELMPRRLDVWHSPDFIPPSLPGPRRIITVHDLNFLYYPQYLTLESRRYYVDGIEWAVETADHILADSEHTRQDLISRLGTPATKVTTAYLAANPLYRQPVSGAEVQETLTAYGLHPGFVLFVGTLEPRKNVPTLLQAFARMRARHGVGVPLVLVGGKGWLYDEIFATIGRLKLSDWVHHLSGVPDQKLAHLYHAAGVLALPSYYEGFGLPPLEAMHCGCPVVVSNRASLPEIVGAAGPLLDPDDVEGWAESLAHVLQDEQRQAKMIAAGHEQASRFSWQTTAAATLEAYEGVMNQ